MKGGAFVEQLLPPLCEHSLQVSLCLQCCPAVSKHMLHCPGVFQGMFAGSYVFDAACTFDCTR